MLAETFAVGEVRTEALPPGCNVAPTQQILAVAMRRGADEEGKRTRALGTFRWGLVPSWAIRRRDGTPMVLGPGAWSRWLDPDMSERSTLEGITG